MNKLLDFTQFLNENEIVDASTMSPQLFAANFGVTIDQLREQNRRGKTVKGFSKIYEAMTDMIEYDNGRIKAGELGKKHGFKISNNLYGAKLDTFVKNFFKKIYMQWEDENWKDYCANREIFKLAMTWWLNDENMFQITTFVNFKRPERIKILKNFTEAPKKQKQPPRSKMNNFGAADDWLERKTYKSLSEMYTEIKRDLFDDIELIKMWVFSGLSFDEFVKEKRGTLASKKFGF